MISQQYNPQKYIQELMTIKTKLMSGLRNLMDMESLEIATTPKEEVYKIDNVRIFHYKPTVSDIHSVPVLVIYALVNRQYMLDLHEKRSILKRWLDQGLDVYMVDWGYPGQVDKYLTMEDYIQGYINDAVDFILEKHGLPSLNIIGICQGGTNSIIYTALYPKKVKNLVTVVTPFHFQTTEGLLNRFSFDMDIDAMVGSARGLFSGESMNFGYNMLKPFELTFDKYLFFIDKMDDKEALMDFMRMETWIYDSPNQAGPMLTKFIKDLYQDNKLAKNELVVGGEKVDLNNITMPVLCLLAQNDHLVAPSCTRPFVDAIPSTDKTLLEYPMGHIGMFVSSRAQNEIGPAIGSWLKER